ncbi:unnamed protein product [Alopecurus aequalis]
MAANPRVYFDIALDGVPEGRIEKELFADVVPKTAENFRALCTGEKGTAGHPLHYKGSTIHVVVPEFVCGGGDFTKGNGSGGESIYGGKFEDENFVKKHIKAGMLSMFNTGPNTNSSQFMITLAPCPSLDGKYVAFGQVIGGMEVVRAIEKLGTPTGNKFRRTGEVTKTIIISDCGVF